MRRLNRKVLSSRDTDLEKYRFSIDDISRCLQSIDFSQLSREEKVNLALNLGSLPKRFEKNFNFLWDKIGDDGARYFIAVKFLARSEFCNSYTAASEEIKKCDIRDLLLYYYPITNDLEETAVFLSYVDDKLFAEKLWSILEKTTGKALEMIIKEALYRNLMVTELWERYLVDKIDYLDRSILEKAPDNYFWKAIDENPLKAMHILFRRGLIKRNHWSTWSKSENEKFQRFFISNAPKELFLEYWRNLPEKYNKQINARILDRLRKEL